MYKFLFDEKKAAQATAFFLMQSGGRLNILKLTKLLYLAEREFLGRYGEPMIGDDPVSMPHGPVLSRTLNLTNGDEEPSSLVGGWDSWIKPRQGYDIELVDSQRSLEELGHLSRANLDVLNAVWSQFGSWNKYDLRDHTHRLPEWVDPNGSMLRIDLVDLLRAVLPGEDVEQLCEHLHELDVMQRPLDAANRPYATDGHLARAA